MQKRKEIKAEFTLKSTGTIMLLKLDIINQFKYTKSKTTKKLTKQELVDLGYQVSEFCPKAVCFFTFHYGPP